jgi:hypothetical protein
MPKAGRILSRVVPVVGALCLVLGRLSGEEQRPPEEALRAVEERGRSIALYLEATSEAGAALVRQTPQAAAYDRSVVIQGREGWRVVFLKESGQDTTGKRWAMVAEALFNQVAGEVGEVRVFTPPRSAPAATAAYARALQEGETAARSRPDVTAPFTEVIFKEEDGTFVIYLWSEDSPGTPREGPGEAGAVRFDSDLVLRTGGAGRQGISVDPLHSGASSVPLAPRPAGQPTLHVHAQGDLPTPTDVALILRHPTLAPHLVLTPRFMFRIDSKGGIAYLGPNQGRAEGDGRPDSMPRPGGGGAA